MARGQPAARVKVIKWAQYVEQTADKLPELPRMFAAQAGRATPGGGGGGGVGEGHGFGVTVPIT